jgi:hypothetical protein
MARRKKQNEDDQENNDNINNESDDTFGLPEVEYEPLKRDEPKEEVQPEPVVETSEPAPVYERTYEEPQEPIADVAEREHFAEEEERASYTYTEEDEPSQLPKYIIIALLLLAVAGGGYYYFKIYRPEAKRKAEVEAETLARRAEQKRLAEKAAADAELARQAEQRKLDSLANLSKTGTLEKLEGRTGRYYVVVASAIDVDLLTDFGNQLVKKGATVRIIPPFGKTKFNRLAVDVKDTYADAQATADSMKGGYYGNDIWVVRY